MDGNGQTLRDVIVVDGSSVDDIFELQCRVIESWRRG